MTSSLRTLFRKLLLGLGAAACAFAAAAADGDPFIVMSSTTSTEQSGLFAHLLPAFKKARGIDVRVVAQGTGQALDMGRRGDADILFVHDQPAEEKFVAEGFGLQRRPVMYNDFILLGPADDPAGTRGKDIVAALKKLAASNSAFVSRGDRSGTHAAELRYWKQAGIDDPAAAATSKTFAYRACGCGMGPALNIAASSDAYVLADRGTWLAFKNPGKLAILVEGDTRLFNQYGVIVVNPARHPHVKVAQAQAFADWVVSPEGQAVIAAYKIEGKQLFFPERRPLTAMPAIDREQITGMVLAGGRGSRMGGVDKGLQGFRGMPLAMHALFRLQAQVGETMLNANRNLAAYESMGVPVWPDALPDYPGPLAGFLAGLERCETAYLVVVPCDTPLFPEDLVERLAAAFADEGTEIAVAATREDGELQAQPVFCMMRTTVMESLVRFIQSGQRKIDRWTALHATRLVEFPDADAFANANTSDELQQLQRHA